MKQEVEVIITNRYFIPKLILLCLIIVWGVVDFIVHITSGHFILNFNFIFFLILYFIGAFVLTGVRVENVTEEIGLNLPSDDYNLAYDQNQNSLRFHPKNHNANKTVQETGTVPRDDP